jgi:hypothetical protein
VDRCCDAVAAAAAGEITDDLDGLISVSTLIAALCRGCDEDVIAASLRGNWSVRLPEASIKQLVVRMLPAILVCIDSTAAAQAAVEREIEELKKKGKKRDPKDDVHDLFAARAAFCDSLDAIMNAVGMKGICDVLKSNANAERDPSAASSCDWGSLTYNKVKKFHLERVFDELEWMAKHKCGFISITDANFGMFPERDNLIADKIIEVQSTYGYPKTFSVAWAKNQKREVVEIVKKLLEAPGFNQGLTLSVQSLDLDVLENIRRKNMEMNKLNEVFELCEQRNIPTYTELILGLPGESLESLKKNFWTLFEMGNHTGLTVFQAQLLENAEMNLLQKKLFKITSQPVTDYFSGSYSNEHVEESIDIITGTKDMPFDTMLDAHV